MITEVCIRSMEYEHFCSTPYPSPLRRHMLTTRLARVPSFSLSPPLQYILRDSILPPYSGYGSVMLIRRMIYEGRRRSTKHRVGEHDRTKKYPCALWRGDLGFLILGFQLAFLVRRRVRYLCTLYSVLCTVYCTFLNVVPRGVYVLYIYNTFTVPSAGSVLRTCPPVRDHGVVL